jgi:hypothetical protein
MNGNGSITAALASVPLVSVDANEDDFDVDAMLDVTLARSESRHSMYFLLFHDTALRCTTLSFLFLPG